MTQDETILGHEGILAGCRNVIHSPIRTTAVIDLLDKMQRNRCNPKFTFLPRDLVMKRTYQPSVVRRKRTHGFLVRMRTRGGQAVIRARRAKGRHRLSV